MKMVTSKSFANGNVYLLKTDDGFPVETTDTWLPFYTKDAIGNKQNALKDYQLGDRSERWMIGVSVASGCKCGCKFCAAAQLKKWRNLTAEEIVSQVDFIVGNNPEFSPSKSKEFKINYTRMGEPFINIEAVKKAISIIDAKYGNVHHYLSTIGVRNTDYSWIKGNITLQVSLHSLDESKRNWLIPYSRKVSIEELGQIRTSSNLKTTVNMTLVDESDFNLEALQKYFDPKYFFIKVSPINKNATSEANNLGDGVIKSINIV
jgi:MoaA/NifB/PqqE/SkfB family radical SAM enzyme